MKKIYGIFAAVLVLAAGCAKEELQSPVENGGKTVLTAGFADTKTVLVNEGKVCWTNGDKIVVNGVASAALELSEPNTSASFTFNGILAVPYKAVFPASIYKDATTVTLPSVQKSNASSFHAEASPMIAYQTEGSNLTFSHPFAVVKLNINLKEDSHKISYVEFKGNNGEQLCGDFTVDYTSLTLTGAEVAENNKALHVNVNRSLEQGTACSVHIVVPAITYSAGFTVKVVDNMGHYMEKSVKSEKQIAAGTVYNMAAFDFEPTDTELGVEINSADELIAFANNWNTGKYASSTSNPLFVTLKNNIEFTEDNNADWPGIGVDSDDNVDDLRFDGVFNGDGHTISNFTSKNALFNYLGSEGIVSGLSLEGNVTYDMTGITATTNAGPFAMRSWGTVKNCSSAVNVTITSAETITKEIRVGGFIGYMTSGELTGCSYSGSLRWQDSSSASADARIGGLIGCISADAASVNDSYMSGSVVLDATQSGTLYGGGLVGSTTSPLNNCWTTEDALVSVSNTGKTRLGGIVGFADGNTQTNCINRASITVNSSSNGYTQVGGVVGHTKTTIDGCDNSGTITITKAGTPLSLGGIVGYNNDGSVESCENMASGTVTVNDVDDGKLKYCGGCVGYSISDITGCINRATVSSAQMSSSLTSSRPLFGGIVGYFTGNELSDCTNYGSVSNNFNTVANTSSDGSTDKTKDALTGGIVGYACGAADKTLMIQNCTNETVTSAAISAVRGWVGGIVGYSEYVTVSECYSKMTLSGQGHIYGGISGHLENATITDSHCTTDLTGFNAAPTKNVGGVVGRCTNSNSGTSKIDNCSYTGNISGTNVGSNGKGAIFGYAESSTKLTVSNCQYDANIDKSDNTWYGGKGGSATLNLENNSWQKE